MRSSSRRAVLVRAAGDILEPVRPEDLRPVVVDRSGGDQHDPPSLRRVLGVEGEADADPMDRDGVPAVVGPVDAVGPPSAEAGHRLPRRLGDLLAQDHGAHRRAVDELEVVTVDRVLHDVLRVDLQIAEV